MHLLVCMCCNHEPARGAPHARGALLARLAARGQLASSFMDSTWPSSAPAGVQMPAAPPCMRRGAAEQLLQLDQRLLGSCRPQNSPISPQQLKTHCRAHHTVVAAKVCDCCPSEAKPRPQAHCLAAGSSATRLTALGRLRARTTAMRRLLLLGAAVAALLAACCAPLPGVCASWRSSTIAKPPCCAREGPE